LTDIPGGLARPATHVRRIFALIIAATFLDVVDFSIIQVALPTIQNEFLAPLAEIQWVVGAYGITLAGFLMLSGRAGDIYGQKKIFVAGNVIFTLASFAGGLAPSLLVLIIFRAVQGIGAAMSTVTAFAIFITLFREGKERNRYMGIFVAVLSAGFAAGSVAGGALTVLFGWRSVMFVNVPIGIAAVVLSQRLLPSSGGWLKNQRLDMPGAITVTSGLVLLVYALTNAANLGFSALETYLPLGLSAVVLAAFVAIESCSKSPLLPLHFLRRGSVLTANVLGLVLASTVVGLAFIVTIYLQEVLGYTPLYAGLGFLPGAVIFFVVGGWGASRIIDRIGVRRTLLTSTALVTTGYALLTQISPTGTYFGILPGMILWALGASVGFPALSIAAMTGTRSGEEGLASGLINTSFRVGFPLGLAVLLTVAGATDPAPVGAVDPIVVAAGMVTGFQYALVVAALLGLLGFMIAFRIKDPGTWEGNREIANAPVEQS
jgi:EmrB/QacA subfamily drug resistance transporter